MSPINVLEKLVETSKEYSICTLVTRPNEYAVMQRSFLERGFDEATCEYLVIDNSQRNVCDAYQGVNMFLRAARGRRIIICHQDIELIGHGKAELDARLDELEQLDPRWAIAGNCGGRHDGALEDYAVRISDPWGDDVARGPFPCRARGLDENFVVIKADANLAASGDLRGFHLYAMDLAIVAGVLGYNAYVIDFHVRHYSPGRLTAADFSLEHELGLLSLRRKLMLKYARAFAPRWHTTTTAQFMITPQLLANFRANLRVAVEERRREARFKIIRLKERVGNAILALTPRISAQKSGSPQGPAQLQAPATVLAVQPQA